MILVVSLGYRISHLMGVWVFCKRTCIFGEALSSQDEELQKKSGVPPS